MANKVKDLEPIEINTRFAQKVRAKLKKDGWKLKLPIMKQLYRKKAHPDGIKHQAGMAIPVNIDLGSYDDQVLHRKVTEYFIEKAGTIVLMDCPCRTFDHCENHDVHVGCTYMGKGAAKMDLSKFPGARLATKEEAYEIERKAYDNGLITHLGKFRGDAEHFGVVDYQNELMSICHCCSCCCIVGLAKYGNNDFKKMVKRLDGVEVRVDHDKCTGCGKCFKVCIYDGLKMKNDKTSVKQKNCLGCGRCERVCPSEAITVTIDDYTSIDEIAKRFDERVDISG